VSEEAESAQIRKTYGLLSSSVSNIYRPSFLLTLILPRTHYQLLGCQKHHLPLTAAPWPSAGVLEIPVIFLPTKTSSPSLPDFCLLIGILGQPAVQGGKNLGVLSALNLHISPLAW
jgi:hypothetical protein